MIWILASLPFWFLGLTGFTIGGGAMIYGLWFAEKNARWLPTMAVAVAFVVSSGTLMIFAAWMVS